MSDDRVHIPFDPRFKVAPEDAVIKPAWCVFSDARVFVRCVHGWMIGSPTKHSIGADGVVNASLVGRHGSTDDPCNWHVMGILDDWEDGAMDVGHDKLARKKLARINAQGQKP